MSSKITFYLLISVLVTSISHQTEYFVSVDGNDSNSGTAASPFQHVQRAVDFLQPGDVCTIRGGRYTEQVSLNALQGSPGKLIRFQAYPGETVVFDGTIPLVAKWSKYKDNIYMTNLQDIEVWQLFVDGVMQVNARWPNAFWKDFSVFDYTRWGFSSVKSTYNYSSGEGVMCDNGTQNLAGSGINATGAMAILNIGSSMTWVGSVQQHVPGDSSFKYKIPIPKQNFSFDPDLSRYFLEDKLEFLDAPTEWYYDQASGSLYLWTEHSDSPENCTISRKLSTYAIKVSDNSNWLVFSRLNFFGTTMYINSEPGELEVHDIVLDSLHFTYPSYTKRMLRSTDPPSTTTIYYNLPLTPNAGNFTIFNCTWEYADGQTMQYRGADGLIQNNLWRYNDFSSVGNGALLASEGARDKFVRNVVHSNGPGVGFQPGAGSGAVVQLNCFYDLKFLQTDGSHIEILPVSQEDVMVDHNWAYNTIQWGMRFDCNGCNKSSESWGHNGTMQYNVVWNSKGMSVSGDYQHVYNNLIFNSSFSHDLLLVSNADSGGIKGENEHTNTSYNILQNGACSVKTHSKCPDPIPGYYQNNVEGNVRLYLRDPENFDFRPKPNTNLTQNKTGPYGKESLSHGGTYWIPGRQSLIATVPIPPNGSVTAKCDADLMWLSGYLAHMHNVYFSTDNIAVLKRSSSVFLGQMEVPSNILTPGELQPSLTYYWAVDAIGSEVQFGELWWFKCQE